MDIGPRLPDELPQLDLKLQSLLHGVQVEFQWQAQRMPAVSRQLLLEHVEPGSVRPNMLLSELQMSPETVRLDAPVLRKPYALSPEACATLRNAVDRDRQTKADTVDGAPDEQLNLSRERLEELVGAAAVAALWRLPAELLGGRASSVDTREDSLQIFVRRYAPNTRPWTPFHVDSARVTINVALSDEGACAGGELLAVHGDGVRAVVRGEGEATVHSSELLHGVSRLASGGRHTLIIFVGRAAQRLPAELRFDATDRATEAAALARLIMANADLGHDGPSAPGSAGGLRAAYEAMRSRKRRRADDADGEGEDECGSVASVAADSSAAEAERVGAQIERVVQHYAAPHLRPTDMLARNGTADGVVSSLRALLTYAAELK